MDLKDTPNLVTLSGKVQPPVMRLKRQARMEDPSKQYPEVPPVKETQESQLDKLLKAAAKKAQEQQQMSDSHWTFSCEILGNKNLDPAHQDLCQFLDEYHRYKLILLPRGSLKTTLITIGSTTRRIVRNPNTRTLIVSELLKNSKKMIGAVKAQFESNKTLIDLYGDLVPKRDEGKWNDTELVVTSRTLYQAKEATVTAAGLDVEQTSAHFDYMLMDDLMSKNNTQTKEQIEKVIDYVKLCYPLLDPSDHAQMIFIGTRWHFQDLYQYLIDSKRCAVFQLGAYQDAERKILSFPSLLKHTFLDDQKIEMGPGHFANQYLNIPMDDDSAKFKHEWFQPFTDDMVPKGCYITTTIDPAISKEPTADETFIVTVAVDHENNWFVLEERHGRWDPFEITAQVFEAYGLWHPHQVGLEKFGFQATLEYFFNQEMARRQQYFHIEDLKVDSRVSKEARIEGLIPLYAAKKVFHRDTNSELCWQLRRYPKYAHDDGADALSHQLQLVGTGSKMPHTQEVKEGSLVALHAREQRRQAFEGWSFPQESRPGMFPVW